MVAVICIQKSCSTFLAWCVRRTFEGTIQQPKLGFLPLTMLQLCHFFQGHCDHPSNCRFDWDSKEQGLILGGFAIGYVLTQYMGAFLAERYGGKFSAWTNRASDSNQESLFNLLDLFLIQGLPDNMSPGNLTFV